MKILATLVLAAAVTLTGAAVIRQDQAPQQPKPTEEHAWVQKLAGEWTWEGQMTMAEGAPPMSMKGTESARKIGDFWVVSEISGDSPMGKFTGIMSMGYDPAKKAFVGTWLDSMSTHMWSYNGKLDEAKKTLTLEAEGPHFVTGKPTQFRDTVEVKSDTEKVMTSTMKGDDGKWITYGTTKYTRKK